MATTKPRLTVTLSPQVYETICRLADLSGESRSAVISGLVEGVHDPLMRTVALMEAARDAPAQVREGLRGTVLAMEREFAGVAGGALAQLDWLSGELDGTQGEGKRSAPRPGAAPVPPGDKKRRSTPVPVTRGSGDKIRQLKGAK